MSPQLGSLSPYRGMVGQAASEILISPPTLTLTEAVATSALTVAESVAVMLAAPPASTAESPITPDPLVLVIVLVAPTPATKERVHAALAAAGLIGG